MKKLMRRFRYFRKKPTGKVRNTFSRKTCILCVSVLVFLWVSLSLSVPASICVSVCLSQVCVNRSNVKIPGKIKGAVHFLSWNLSFGHLSQQYNHFK